MTAQHFATSDAARVAGSADSEPKAASSQRLSIEPHVRREGFWASIRGHVLDLADPGSGHGLAPTPDDLFIAAVASGLAWSTRDLLRANDLPDDVSVSADWCSYGNPARFATVTFTVTIPRGAEAIRAGLTALLEEAVATRCLTSSDVHISVEGGSR